MKTLDRTDEMKKTDKNGMAGLVNEFPEMLKEALEIPCAKPQIKENDPVRNIIIAGMGGSAISGDIVSRLMMEAGSVPVAVIRNYELPKYANRQSLVFVLSYSGNTEETLSVYEQALKAGAKIIAITSGGTLEQRTASDNVPFMIIRPGLPPRASMPYLLVPMLMALEDLGFLPGARSQVQECITVLREMRLQLNIMNIEQKNPAKQVASALKDKIPMIFGSASGSDAAAFRWKTQFSENSKITSIWNVFPELDHNEIVNLGELKKGSNSFALVLLRDRYEGQRMKKRIDITREIVSPGIENVFEIWSEGKGHLSRILSLIYFGDWVSVYLALLNGTDPTPVISIDKLKRELSV